jgi:hypothetical protein
MRRRLLLQLQLLLLQAVVLPQCRLKPQLQLLLQCLLRRLKLNLWHLLKLLH